MYYEALVTVSSAAVALVVAYGGLPYLIQYIKKLFQFEGVWSQLLTFVVVAIWTFITYVADGTLTEGQLLATNWEWLFLVLMGASQWGYGENKGKIQEKVNYGM